MLLPLVEEFCSQPRFGGLEWIARNSDFLLDSGGGDGRRASCCNLKKLPAILIHRSTLKSLEIVKIYLAIAIEFLNGVLV